MAYVLALIGYLLIFLEFYLPGGVMGSAGAIVLIASVVVYATATDSLVWVMLFILVQAVVLIFLIRYILKRIQSSGQKETIYLDTDQSGYHAPTFDHTAVGKEGEAISRLNPAGHVSVDGAHHQAISQSGYIEKGEKVTVVQGRGAYLVVKPSKEGATP